jgi:hypothetical protein
MITLINTSKNYSVTSETVNFKLSGNAAVIQETGNISNFNGSFTTTEGVYCGNFNYSENDNGKANKNIYDVDKENFAELGTLLDNAIEELKQELNDNE